MVVEGGVVVLYHQTDRSCWKLIQESGRMKCGSIGLAGGGIYFALSKSATDGKAHRTGVVLTCEVRLGRVKEISYSGDYSITSESLRREGFDSVMIPRSAGHEYVVYQSDQVTVLDHDYR